MRTKAENFRNAPKPNVDLYVISFICANFEAFTLFSAIFLHIRCTEMESYPVLERASEMEDASMQICDMRHVIGEQQVALVRKHVSWKRRPNFHEKTQK